MTGYFRLIALIAIAALAVGACDPATAAAPTDRAVSEAQATQVATDALNAFNAGDYEGWTRDWSQTMRDAIKEADFLAFRDQVIAAKGTFVSVESVDVASNKPGTYRYTFTLVFEKGTATFGFAFVGDGTAVEGVFYE